MLKIGIIGGSGLEKPKVFTNTKEIHPETPYGKPSSSIFKGVLASHEVYILSRHDRDHSIPPTYVNNLANIHAFKQLGVNYLIATTACGSLREEIKPGDLVIPDQFIDFTRSRRVSFYDHFEPGKVMHTAMPDPFSPFLRDLLYQTGKEMGLPLHPGGTIITIEGSRFSTRAESKMYRIWGADLVNMSVAPEAILANEAGIPYAAVAMSTDYDSWRESGETVSWDELLKVFEKNADFITSLLRKTIERLI
ncbi:MAG: MTAP family purine nucleoside phosphorylase [Bacteroidetes bacterium]|nr:MTAP family purine nucleoside phosphorylase [Bacteroidota bacterium]